MLNENFEIFVMHIATLEALLVEMPIHLDKKAQIASFLIKKVTILNKYFDFTDEFSKEKALMLLKQINLNKHTIKLERDKQPSYKLIYSLTLVKLQTLKVYIKTYLKTGLI